MNGDYILFIKKFFDSIRSSRSGVVCPYLLAEHTSSDRILQEELKILGLVIKQVIKKPRKRCCCWEDVPQRLWSLISPKLPQAWPRWLLMFLCAISVTFLHRETILFKILQFWKLIFHLTEEWNITMASYEILIQPEFHFELCGTTTWTKMEVKIKMVCWPLLVESCIFTSFPAQILAVQLCKFVVRQGRDFHIVSI